MRAARFALGMACVLASGCAKRTAATKPAPLASAPALQSRAEAASARAQSGAALNPSGEAPALARPPPACRALLVTGKSTVGGAPIAIGTLLDGHHWVDLESGATVALRHTLTSREFKLIGPGRILPCRNGAEQILISTGKLSTSAGPGVRPGAEVLIATPSASVRYGDAALDLDSGARGLGVRVKQGQAWVEPENQGQPPFHNPVSSGTEAHVRATLRSPSQLVDACRQAAEHAHDSAARVLERGNAFALRSLGSRAASHMRDRAAARVACATAQAALGGLADSVETQRLTVALASAEELWQSIPHPVSADKN